MAILSVVQFEGLTNKKWLVYKVPGNEFTTKSKCIVGPGQIAVLVHGGKVENIFESGTYTLNTENLPFIKSFQKRVYGGSVPYQMEVYFVNKTLKMDMLWGTKDPIPLLDPKFNVRINIRARGQYALRVKEYQLIVSHLVGALGDRSLVDYQIINEYFRGLINTKIKTLIAQEITNKQISILDLSVYLDELSQKSFNLLNEEFNKFGFEMINFYYESINIPDDDLERINQILNKKAEFEILGDYQYRTSRGYDVLESAAKNEGAGGSLAAAGLGLGVGLGAAKEVSAHSQDMIPKPGIVLCKNCKKDIEENDKFCPHCGSSQAQSCEKCGEPLTSDMKFCPECGTSIKKG